MQVDIILNEYDSPRAMAEQAVLAERYGTGRSGPRAMRPGATHS